MFRRLTLSLVVAVAGLSLLGTAAASAVTYTIPANENSEVTTAALKEDVSKCNAASEACTIVLGSGSYLPEKTINIENANAQITLEGPAGTPTTSTPGALISGSSFESAGELIFVETGASLRLKNVQVTTAGGSSYPGIEVNGTNDNKTKVPGGILTLENSTLTGVETTVAVQPGATLTASNTTIADGRADGVYNFGKAKFLNSTVAYNTQAGIENSGEETVLTNTIVAQNKGGDCIGTVTTSDHSLDSDGSCGVGALSKTNPLLKSTPINNGGSVPFHVVKPGSPAIKAGDKATCLTVDEPYASRVAECTIGADEYSSTAPTVTVPSNITKEAETASGAKVTYSASAVGVGDRVTSFKCTPFESGETFPVGVTKVKCTAIDGHENTASKEFSVTITAKAPAVTTSAASAITSGGATLNGSVNPDGANVTACTFEYGTSISYGKTASCSSLPGSGTSAVAVSATVAGLAAGTTYDYRLVATNGTGTGTGSNETFKTSAATTIGPEAYSNGKALSTNHVAVTGFGEIKLKSEVIGVVKCQNTFYGEAWNQVVGSETKGVGEIDGWGTSGCEAPTYVPTLEIADTKQIEKHEVVCQAGYPGTEIGKGKCFTVTATSELPLETEKVEAEVCAKEGEALSKCKEPSEKKVVKLISAVRRRVASTPWKAELVRGEREEEAVVLQRTGVHTFGEAGAGESAQNQTGSCYPKEGAKPASFKAVPSGCIAVTIIFPQIPDEIVFYGSQEARGINGSKNGLFPSTLEFNEESGSFFSSENSAGVNNRTLGNVKTIGTSAIELLTTK